MIKGFIFDLDGVITETDVLHYNAWKNEVAKYGINFTMEQNVQLKGMPRMDTLLGILRLNDATGKFDQETLEKMCKDKNDAYVASLETDLQSDNILPGIEEFLKQAKAKGIKMAICSSSRNAPKILDKLNLTNYFEYIVDPITIPNGKPAPDIYLAACKGINLPIEEVVGFEDAYPGVVGLVAANVKCVAITHKAEADWSIAQMILESTSELDIDKVLAL